MSLRIWGKSGWLQPQSATLQRVADGLALVDRELADFRQNLSVDGRFIIAYNAARQLCALALLAEGWKPVGAEAAQHTLLALPVILGRKWRGPAAYLETCRLRCHQLMHEAPGRVTVAEANQLGDFATGLNEVVVAWLGKRHPRLMPGNVRMVSGVRPGRGLLRRPIRLYAAAR